MNKTPIEYLDYTWNPIAMRCDRCSPGCLNCWHLRTADRLSKNPALPENERAALAGTGPSILRERELSVPLSLKKPSVIGVQFMGDLFHEDVPDGFRADIYGIMNGIARHTYIVLTKRPEQMLKYFEVDIKLGWKGKDHIWHGLTIVNQEELDRLGPIFSQVPGKKLISHEPALGMVNWGLNLYSVQIPDQFDRMGTKYPAHDRDGISCLISGGETGPGARPSHPDIFRSDRDQCAAAGVPFFFKQWGEWVPDGIELFYGDDGFTYVATHRGELMPMYIAADSRTRSNIGKLSSIRAFPIMPIRNKDGHTPIEVMHKVPRNKAGRLLDGWTHDELPWRKP
jgi:protein gp37